MYPINGFAAVKRAENIQSNEVIDNVGDSSYLNDEVINFNQFRYSMVRSCMYVAVCFGV